MTTRAERRRGPDSRVVPPGMRLESPGAGSNANSHWRDLASAAGSIHGAVSEETVVEVVRGMREFIDGPLSRYVLEIGRFIDEGGRYTVPSAGGAGSTVTVEETGSAPVYDVDTIIFDPADGYSVVDSGSGRATVSFTGGGSAGESVTESSHGFSAGEAVHFDGSNWVKADADDSKPCHGIVLSVDDASTFTLVDSGVHTISSHGFTLGQNYLSTTAGGVSTTPPGPGDIVQKVLIAYTTDKVLVQIGEGSS